MKLPKMVLIFALLFLSTSAPAQEASYDDFLKPGTTLIYNVDNYSENYLFIVKILEYGNDGIAFEYMMTDHNFHGKIAMSEEALLNAKKMFNYFSGGEDMTFDDRISVWYSKAIYDELKQSNSTTFHTGDSQETFTLDPETGINSFPVTVDKKFGDINNVEVMSVYNDELGYSMQLLNDETHRLIVRMAMSFTITLKAIL